MPYQFKVAETQEEIDAFRQLRHRRIQAFSDEAVNLAPRNYDELPGTVLFIALDAKGHVVAGARITTSVYNPGVIYPTEERLAFKLGEFFDGRGVSLHKKVVADISGIHIDPALKKDPGVILDFTHRIFNYCNSRKADVCLAAPTEPFDQLVKTMLRRHHVAYLEIGHFQHEIYGAKTMLVFTNNATFLHDNKGKGYETRHA